MDITYCTYLPQESNAHMFRECLSHINFNAIPAFDDKGFFEAYVVRMCKNAHILKMERNYQVIGICAVYVNQLPTAHITFFGIYDEYENCGYGKVLLNYALDYMRNLGATRVTLETDSTNASAKSLYLKNGFNIDGVDGTIVKMSRGL